MYQTFNPIIIKYLTEFRKVIASFSYGECSHNLLFPLSNFSLAALSKVFKTKDFKCRKVLKGMRKFRIRKYFLCRADENLEIGIKHVELRCLLNNLKMITAVTVIKIII